MFKKIALSGLETLLNMYLKLDSEIGRLLTPLCGKILTIETTKPPLQLHFLFEKTSVRLLDSLSINPDASIRGSTFNFIQHFIQDPQATQGLTIQGDSAVLIHFANLFQKIDIDWEEHLSKLVGDHSAHLIGKLVRNVISYGVRCKNTVQQNVTEYLQEEIHCFPTREEVTLFLDDVDTLRNDVERFEAKLKLNKINRGQN